MRIHTKQASASPAAAVVVAGKTAALADEGGPPLEAAGEAPPRHASRSDWLQVALSDVPSSDEQAFDEFNIKMSTRASKTEMFEIS